MSKFSAGAVLTLAAGLVSACADTATEPSAAPGPSSTINFAFTDTDVLPSFVLLGEVWVCKTVNVGAPAQTFGFTYTLNAGGATAFSVPSGTCTRIYDHNPADPTPTLVITENAPPTNWALTAINTLRIGAGVAAPGAEDLANRSATVIVNDDFARVVTFVNTYTSPVGCTFTQGYWKTHAGTKKQADAWPAGATSGGLTLGTVHYTKAELLSIMNAPTVGNGLISLGTQLIAAKLNVYPGTTADITAADALIGGLVIPPVGSGFLATSVTDALNTALTNFNEGITGPGHCLEDVIR